MSVVDPKVAAVALDLLPEGDDLRAGFTAEARRLLGLLSAPLPPGVTDLVAALAPQPGQQPAPPEELRAAIHRRLGAFPIANLLAHAPESWEPRGADLDRLRAWVLVGLLDAALCGQAGHTTAPKAAALLSYLCRARTRAGARLLVPSISAEDVTLAQQSVEDWYDRLRQTRSVIAETAYVLRLTLDHLAGQARQHRAPTTRSTTPRCALSIAAIRGFVVLPGRDGLALEHDCPDFDREAEDLESAEEAGDVATPARLRLGEPEQMDLLEVLDRDDQGGDGEVGWQAGLPAPVALAAQGELAELPAQAVTSTRALTPAEAMVVVQGLRQAVHPHSGPWQAATLLAVSLMTGRSLPALLALPREVPRHAGQSWWARDWEAAADRIGIGFCPAVTDAPPPPHNGFVLVLPRWLQPSLRRLLDQCEQEPFETAGIEADAQRLLAGLLPEGRALRRSHLAASLGLTARTIGLDPAVEALLVGTDIRIAPQCWYTALPVPRLDADWRACWPALGLTEDEGEEEDGGDGMVGARVVATLGARTGRARREVPRTGSLRVPSDVDLRAFFAGHRQRLETAVAALEPDLLETVQEVQAAFVGAAAAVLLGATGRRPHGPLWPPLGQALTEGPAPAVRIADKGNRTLDDARWLPLPPVAVATLEAVRVQLGHLQDWGRLHDRQVAATADKALAGTAPPLWFLPSGGADLTPLSCATWWQTLPERVPRNLFRHFWRSRFVAERQPGHLVDRWMGHGGWRQTFYLSTSFAGSDDLAPLAESLERGLADLGAVAPEPCPLL